MVYSVEPVKSCYKDRAIYTAPNGQAEEGRLVAVQAFRAVLMGFPGRCAGRINQSKPGN